MLQYVAMDRSLLKLSLTLVAGIIGAGVFALPSAFARVGILPASLVFWGMAAVVLATHLMLVDVELSLEKRGRLTSAIRLWLGEGVFRLASITYPVQLLGAILAYLVLGASFLQTLLGPMGTGAPVVVFKLAFWILASITVLGGLRWVTRVEAVAVRILIVLLLGASLFAWQGPRLSLEQDWSGALSLFGVCLFSLMGVAGVAEVVDVARHHHRRRARIVTVVGTLLAASVSWLFAVSFAGSLTLTASFLPWLLALAGFFAVSGAYIINAQDLGATLSLDLAVRPALSLLIALGIPLLLALSLRANFLNIVDVVGTLFGGLNGVFIALTASRVYAHHHCCQRNHRELACLVIGLVYLAGVGYWVARHVL